MDTLVERFSHAFEDAGLVLRYGQQSFEWDEAKHPRGDGGKFARAQQRVARFYESGYEYLATPEGLGESHQLHVNERAASPGTHFQDAINDYAQHHVETAFHGMGQAAGHPLHPKFLESDEFQGVVESMMEDAPEWEYEDYVDDEGNFDQDLAHEDWMALFHQFAQHDPREQLAEAYQDWLAHRHREHIEKEEFSRRGLVERFALAFEQAGLLRYGQMAFDFEEDKHPRADDGKFKAKSGGESEKPAGMSYEDWKRWGKEKIRTKADGSAYVQAPKGGARSPVNGQWYQGGAWMPVTGEKAKPADSPATKELPFDKPAEDPVSVPKEPWQLTKVEFRSSHPDMKKAEDRQDAVRKQMSANAGRWGDTRRFQGMSAGNRLAEVDAAERHWSRVWDRLEKQHRKAVEAAIRQKKAVPPEVLAEYPDLAKLDSRKGRGKTELYECINPGTGASLTYEWLTAEQADDANRSAADDGKSIQWKRFSGSSTKSPQQSPLVERFSKAFSDNGLRLPDKLAHSEPIISARLVERFGKSFEDAGLVVRYARYKPAKGQKGMFDDGPSDPEFEQKHPRDDSGQFKEKAGGAAAPKAKEPAADDLGVTPEEQAKYDQYVLDVRGYKIEPHSIEKWLENYRTVQARIKAKEEAAVADEVRIPTMAEQVRDEFDRQGNTLAKTQAVASEEKSPEGPIVRKRSRIVEDFGEKIGGARKDMARPLGPRKKKSEDDTRPGWMRRYEIRRITASLKPEEEGKWTVADTRKKDYFGMPHTIGIYDSKEQAEKAIPIREVARTHGITSLGTGDDQQFVIYRKVSDRKRPVVKGGFQTYEDAQRYMATHPEEVIEHQFPRYETFQYLDHVQREHPKKRSGDIKPKDFQETFGFRGGEFGNWQSGQSGQVALNHAYDALSDLAEVLDLPARAVSLDGQLAIAFGARGTGGKDAARAHYEPEKVVVNLTKMKGAGTLAHEWAHALDHYFGSQAYPDKNTYPTASSGFRSSRHVLRKEVADAWDNLVDTINTKTVEAALNVDTVTKHANQQREHVAQYVKEIEDGLRPTTYRKVKPFTPEQQKEWDALKQQVLEGDVGKRIYVAVPRSTFGGRETYKPLERMNELFKQATGRSFHTSDEQSTGRYLFWAIRNATDAEKRVKDAEAGGKQVRKGTTEFLRNARDMDNKQAMDYYSTKHEMLARAFESYVEDRLHEKKQKSEYLVAKADNKYYRAFDLMPYPEGEERKAINSAFDRLFKVMEHEPRESERGDHVRLYSRSRKVLPSTPTLVERFSKAFDQHGLRLQRKWAHSEPISGQALVERFSRALLQ